MDSKVRDFVKLETSYIFDFPKPDAENEGFKDKFLTIYRVFEQIIDQNIEAPGVEGLGERLPIELEHIACEKLDRRDIISHFPNIFHYFEPYVRLLVYIIDYSKYDKLKKNPKASLIDYCNALGIKVFIKKEERTNFSEALYDAYSLRNKESHECEKWSTRELYCKLSNTLFSFLYVTYKVMPQIQSAYAKSEGRFSIETSDFVQQNISFPIFFNYVFGYRNIAFYSLQYFNCRIKAVIIKCGNGKYQSCVHFDDDCVIESSDNGEEIEKKKFSLEKAKGKDTLYFEEFNQNGEKVKYRHSVYYYNIDGLISSIETYKHYNRIGEIKASELVFDYLSEGGICAHQYQFEYGTNDQKKKVFGTYYFNKNGLLQCIKNEGGHLIRKYNYNDKGILKSIKESGGIVYKVTYINDQQIFSLYRDDEKSEEKYMKVSYLGNKICKIETQNQKQEVNERLFEYYEL